jgi:hypothetical protein
MTTDVTTTEPTDAASDASSAPKKVAKGAAVYFAVKKLVKGAFVVGAVAAVAKVLRGDRSG